MSSADSNAHTPDEDRVLPLGTFSPRQEFLFLAKRFWSKVKPPVGIGECWLWQGAKVPNGYGQFKFHNKMVKTHRLAYEQIIEPIPDGLVIDHLCRNPVCVNPYHMEPVTNRENILRGQGPPALNARKKYCKNGHLLEGDNVKPWSTGSDWRKCKQCMRDWNSRRTNPTRKLCIRCQTNLQRSKSGLCSDCRHQIMEVIC